MLDRSDLVVYSQTTACRGPHSVHGKGLIGWRSHVPFSKDEPDNLDWQEIAHQAKAGRMMMTTSLLLEMQTTRW